MSRRAMQETVRDGAIDQVEKALAADSAIDKDFHLRQALQLLDVTDVDQ